MATSYSTRRFLPEDLELYRAIRLEASKLLQPLLLSSHKSLHNSIHPRLETGNFQRLL